MNHVCERKQKWPRKHEKVKEEFSIDIINSSQNSLASTYKQKNHESHVSFDCLWCLGLKYSRRFLFLAYC